MSVAFSQSKHGSVASPNDKNYNVIMVIIIFISSTSFFIVHFFFIIMHAHFLSKINYNFFLNVSYTVR